MDAEIENRFNRLEVKMDTINDSMKCLTRMDERQRNMKEGLKNQGQRIGLQERDLDAHISNSSDKFQDLEKINWKHHAISNFIERAFWLTFAAGMAYLFFNIESFKG